MRSLSTRRRLGLESLEARNLLNADPLPVLMVLADQQDFYYKEYGDTRLAIEAAGIDVVVAATTTNPTTPHWNSGQGWESGVVVPDVALADVNSADYSAIVFVGGWGSSMYQYAYNDPNLDGITDNYYANDFYNADSDLGDGQIAPQKVIVNNLINEFLAQDKHVAAICHGVTVLAWARVDGVSPLEGRQVSAPLTVGSPAQYYNETWYNNMDLLGQQLQVLDNGALPNLVSGQYGDPTTTADDVVVDGRIITAENYDSSTTFGQVIAQQVLANLPAENQAPLVVDAAWNLDENSAVGTVVGQVVASDPDAGQTLSYAITGGNTNNAFAIDPATGMITVANVGAVNFEANPVFVLSVQVSDDGDPSLSTFAEITVSLNNLVESPVSVQGPNLLVDGTSGDDTIYLWSGATANHVYAWVNGTSHGGFLLPSGGRVIVFAGDGNDQVYATDLRVSASIYGEGGHDRITGGSADDLLDGGDGWDRIWGGDGNDRIQGGAGNDHLRGREGNDVILGGDGDDTLDGFTGRDLLIGGLGSDVVLGGDGEDLLIGGTTTYDDSPAALDRLLAAWTSEGDVAARLALLAADLQWYHSVQDDNATDTLYGGCGETDLLFSIAGETVYACQEDVVASA